MRTQTAPLISGFAAACVLVHFGLVLTGLQRFDEAAAEFEQSILARPGNAWVHYNQGLLYLSLNQSPQAVHCFRRKGNKAPFSDDFSQFK